MNELETPPAFRQGELSAIFCIYHCFGNKNVIKFYYINKGLVWRDFVHIFINALWVFFIFAFLGWMLEFIVRAITKHDIVNTGFITLPFSPTRGLGAVLIFLVFYKAENPVMIFLGAVLMLTVAKVLASMIFEKIFGFRWIDYSHRKFNLNGYVTLSDALFSGIIALLLTCFVFPILKEFTAIMPRCLALLIPSIITGLIIADVIISVITVVHLRRNLKQMKNISRLLDSCEVVENDEQLREAYEKKLMKNKLFRKRLVKAFPDMEFVDYEKQFDDLKIKFNLMKERNEEVYEKKIEKVEDRPFAFGLSFTKLFWLFFIGSFFGTVLETIWAYFTLGHFEMRVGVVWGPFIPVYGGGAVAITLCLYKLHKASDIIIYIASAVIGATFEYFCSYFQEFFLGTVSWDYSNTPFNIDGRTNLMFALIWGLLGLCWLRYIYPVFSRSLERIPKKLGNILTIILVIFMIINSAFSIMAVYRKTQRDNNIAPKTSLGVFVDKCFNDEYMDFIFPHMCAPEDWGKE